MERRNLRCALPEERTLKISHFETENGDSIRDLRLRYQLWGKMNPERSNVVWVCHALTGNHKVQDWWGGLFGPGKIFDPAEYCIICVNVPGSCYGSTGPLCFNENGERYYRTFPILTIRDFAKALDLVRTHLEIGKIRLGIGASLGGQQLLEWAIDQPDLFEQLIPISTNARHSTYGIAWNEAQRLAIEADPLFEVGEYTAGRSGMIAARAVAMLSYRSSRGYQLAQSDTDAAKTDDFRVSSYQRYQGEKLAARFNAYSYWYLSKAMDSHNLSRNRESLKVALGRITARTLVIGISSDVLFPIHEQGLIFRYIADADFLTIHSPFGHDGFLVEFEQLRAGLEEFLQFEYEPVTTQIA